MKVFTIGYEATTMADFLAALTGAIVLVSRDCIERAVERCHIREMRALTQENQSFFRQGGYGGWREVLARRAVVGAYPPPVRALRPDVPLAFSRVIERALERDPAHYLSSKGAPWSRLADERPPGATIAYEKLLQAWREGRVR